MLLLFGNRSECVKAIFYIYILQCSYFIKVEVLFSEHHDVVVCDNAFGVLSRVYCTPVKHQITCNLKNNFVRVYVSGFYKTCM